MNQLCPCGSGNEFAGCCDAYISGKATAPTAEALMRSRYCAFHQGAVAYLLQTHHHASHSGDERSELQRSIASTQWLNLTIIATHKGNVKDDEGEVQFAAAFRRKPNALALGSMNDSDIGQMHERSRFIRHQGVWLYTDGEQLPPYQPKRNAVCWCGSGLKAKHCHS